ncbi:MMPL family transporter [Corynebacterium jeikeium]|uniref:MMPL family transporter n=1 Tax=Corynebacterium jeikeium TaxID=38289 RepID=UPI0001B71B58|nr:MMPL family transporter [Corynebacterium jeikeium]EEW15703.1 MMPL family protein [Corynebacterium jeikeium ATCC 43734]OOD32742.1 multidrug RND transporter [Corynebacterium jeikeium]WCZ54676.1 Membrane protein YdfJ [Corynebacterium jeikeium]SUY82222.1 RND superfamily drug exporter [Corynebacterium jeikeium]
MAKILFNLGRWSYLHKKRVIAAWLLLLVGIAAAALGFQKGFNDIFEIKDVPSTHATEMLQEKFPGTKNPAESTDVNIVFGAPEGKKLEDPELMAAMDETVASLRNNVPDFKEGMQFGNPVELNDKLGKMLVDQMTKQGMPEATAKSDAENLRMYSADGRYGTMTFSYDVPLPADVTDEDRQAVYDAIQISRDAGMDVEVGGPGFGDPIEVEPISEIAGVVVALVILAFTFGSLLAAGLPLATAIVGVGIGALVTVGATAVLPLNSITPTLGLMIGLAVGIDYALFIMSRYRDELRQGRSRPDAIGLATGTAGSAVVFAGLTVTIALVGLRLANIPFLSYMGYFAAISVMVAVAVALTFLPALLGACGSRVFRKDATFGAQYASALVGEGAAHGYFTGGPAGRGRAVRVGRDDGAGRDEAGAAGVGAGAETGGDASAARAVARGEHQRVDDRQRKHGLASRWIRLVYSFPGISIAVVMLVLAALTLPALNLQLSLPNDKTSNVDSTQRKAAEMIEAGFGPGRNAPFLVVVNGENANPDSPALATYIQGQADTPRDGEQPAPDQGGNAQGAEGQADAQGAGDSQAADGAQAAQGGDAQGAGDKAKAAAQASFIYTMENLGSNIHVKHAQLIGQSEDGLAAQLLITPEGGPTEEGTATLIHALRGQQNVIEKETGVDMGITGLIPIQQDVTDRLSNAMPVYLALVVGLALVLLLMIFRSITVPIMAALGFLLSVGGAFGLTVLVWQEGWAGLWNSPGPLISFMPIFLIGVTFGLAMDYQMFIVSRMRERFKHESFEAAKTSKYTPVEDSVIFGFGMGAKVVTVAALIMIGVFASFIFQPLPFVQIFGFALGAAVLFDAFLVRMTFIPAMMVLLGKATWYMPKWLDRILPTFDVEGSQLERDFRSGAIQRLDDEGRALEPEPAH